MKNKKLFINAKIVVDGQKTILNGALAFNEHIVNVYHDVNDKLLKEYEGNIVNLKGLTILPSFVTISENPDSYSIAKNGIASYISTVSYNDSSYARFIGYYSNNISDHCLMKDYDIDTVCDDYIVKVINQSDLYYDDLIDMDIDVIYDLYNHKTGFDPYRPGVINLAFTNKYYVIIKLDNIHDDVLKFTIDHISHKKVIINSDDMQLAIKRLYKLGYDLNKIVSMTSSNLYSLLKMRSYGGLIKGKPSDFNIVDNDLNIIYKVIGGKALK